MNKSIKNIPLITIIIGVLYIILQLAAGLNYPIFRDEMYYIDCANHPAFGYVDHPPLSIFILMIWKAVFGVSQLSIRIIPAVMGAMLIIITSLITKSLSPNPSPKERGIIRMAQVFSSIAVFSSLYFLAIGGFYSMNVFDSVFWTLLFLILIKIINKSLTLSEAEGSLIAEINKSPSASLRAYWLLFGITAGLGLMNKISVGYLGFGILLAILLTKNRAWLKTKSIWMGGFIAAAIFLPYIIWNILNDFASVEFIQNAMRYKIAALSPVDFLKEQILETNPLNFPVWLTGLIALLFGFKPKLQFGFPKYRVIGLTYIIVLVILIAMGAKPYYLAAAYPVLLAAGAIAICQRLFRKDGTQTTPAPPYQGGDKDSSPSQRGLGGGNISFKIALYLYSALLIISTALLSPMVIPTLPPGEASDYIKKLGIMPSSGERSRQAELPQILADRFGWEELTQKVAKIYNSLPEQEKKYSAVYANNYGEAGAINYYGKKYGLPEAISGHNNHFLWGYGTDSITTLIIISDNIDEVRGLFNEVTELDRTNSPYTMPYENNMPLYLARGLKKPIKEIWKGVKFYI